MDAARRPARWRGGALPVNVLVACDGEEEVGGHSIVDWLGEARPAVDAALVFDGGMVERDVPAFNVGGEGPRRTSTSPSAPVTRDLHSGVYGGAALNAMHALVRTLDGVMPRDGRLPEPLREGASPGAAEIAGWSALPAGADELARRVRRRPTPRAAEDFYLRTWAEPSVDVHGIVGGSPILQKTLVPVEAAGERLHPARRRPGPRRRRRSARAPAPRGGAAGAELAVERWSSAPPGLIDPDARALVLAQDAFEHVLGVRPLLVRTGGAIPLVSALAGLGVPTILSGFALNDSNVHSPNERLVADYLPLGVETVCEVLRRLGGLR